METHRILVKRIIAKAVFISAALSIALTTSLPAFAYDQNETHPALTKAMGEFFNMRQGGTLTPTDIQALARGSVDEDKPFRFFNHFYDPINNRGISKIKTFASSKQWAQDPFAQAGKLHSTAQVMTVGANQTWQKALYEYANGNREQAMYALGHTLHLIADATVPEHVRNDSHTGAPTDPKSPLEDWAKGDKLQQAIRAALGAQSGIQKFGSLDEAFDQTALYTNRNFFSVETVGRGYDAPKTSEPQQDPNNTNFYFIYSLDGQGARYRLAAAIIEDPVRQSFIETIPKFLNDFTVANQFVLNDYWSRLSRKAILNGAGVIDLFLREAEELRQYAEIDPRVLAEMNRSKADESARGFFARVFGVARVLLNESPENILPRQEPVTTSPPETPSSPSIVRDSADPPPIG